MRLASVTPSMEPSLPAPSKSTRVQNGFWELDSCSRRTKKFSPLTIPFSTFRKRKPCRGLWGQARTAALQVTRCAFSEVHVPKSARRHGRWIHGSFPRWLQQGMLGLVPRRQRATSHPDRKAFEEEASACF